MPLVAEIGGTLVVLPILPLSLSEMLTIVWHFMGLLLKIDVDGISRDLRAHLHK